MPSSTTSDIGIGVIKQTKGFRTRKSKNRAHATTRQAREPAAHYVTTTPDFQVAVSEELPRAVQRIVNALHPEKIILFGSYAYGVPTYDSDVDLLVIMETEAKPSERYLAVSRLLRPRQFPVDILVRTPTEIGQALESGDFFVEEILSRGRVLHAN